MKKFIKIASILAALSLFAGCKTQLNPNIETDDSAYIKISTDDNFVRTIEPDWESIEKDNYIYELWGSRQGSIYNVKLGTWLSYKDLTEAAAIKIEPDTWTFELTARKNHTLEFSGSIERKAIKAGKTTLNFILSDRNGPDGYGQIDYKFYFEKPFDYDGYAEFELYNSDGSRYLTPDVEISDVERKDGYIVKCVAYKNDYIKKGFYTVVINIYDSKASRRKLLNRYTSTIRVAKDLISSGQEWLTKKNYVSTISDVVPTLYMGAGEYVYCDPVGEIAESFELYVYETEEDLSVENFDTSKFTDVKEIIDAPYYDRSYFYGIQRKFRKNIYYAVKAVNNKGKSQFSNVVMNKKGPASLSRNGNYLVWESLADADEYELYVCSSPADYDSSIYSPNELFNEPVITSTDTFYEISPSTIGYTYYAVKAVSGKMKSDFSNVFVVRPFAPPVLFINDSGDTLWWTDVDMAEKYVVYTYKAENYIDPATIDKSLFNGINETSKPFIEIENSAEKYTYYAVKAKSGREETDFSDVICVQPKNVPFLYLLPGELTWTPVENAVSYRVLEYVSSSKITDLSAIDIINEPYSYSNVSSESALRMTVSRSIDSFIYYAVQAYVDSKYYGISNIVELEKIETTQDYLLYSLNVENLGAYKVQENDSTNIGDFTLLEWNTSAGVFLSFAVEPNTTYYLDGVDGYSGSYENVTPTHSGSGLRDACYDVYTDENFPAVISGKDSPSDTYFTTSATASTYYIVVRPYGSYETGRAYFRIYKKTTN